MPKNAQTIIQLYSFHILVMVMLKILQARLQRYMNQELPDIQTGFRKGRGTRDQIFNIHWIIRKERNSRKTSTSVLLTTWEPLPMSVTTNCGKFLNRWEYQTTSPASLETCMWVKKQQLEPNMKQLTDSKLGKEYVKAVHCQPAYFTSMQRERKWKWSHSVMFNSLQPYGL